MPAKRRSTSAKSAKSKAKYASSKARAKRRPQDAIALLRADHVLVQGLFDQFERARDDKRKQTLAIRICMELKIHTAIEEEVFYPAVRQALPKADDMLDEAKVEHDSAKDLIEQIEAGGPDEERWDAKVTVLGEYIKHHVKEEQNEMFPKVRKTKVDLEELGERLARRKAELQAST